MRGVDPTRLVRERLRRDGPWAFLPGAPPDTSPLRLPLRVLGAGKPAAAMAVGCVEALGTGQVSGLVVVPDGSEREVAGVTVRVARHPVPDRRGVLATRALLRQATKPGADTLFLLGGGASSVLVLPRPPVRLADKIRVTEELLRRGADITEMNSVRRHLSLVKGGGVARQVEGRLVTLVLSDVVGDDLRVVGSGPTLPDPSLPSDARTILERYGLGPEAFPRVYECLEAPPLPSPRRPGEAWRIGSWRTAVAAAATTAAREGFAPVLLEEPLVGDTTLAANAFARRLWELRQRGADHPRCVLAGGETTVVVRGHGKGGRNQEFALALAPWLDGLDVVVLSAGTDGRDGPTEAAGAFVDGTTMARGRRAGLDPATFLRENDSWHFFGALGDLFQPGPTGTNVMDLKLALLLPGRVSGPPPGPLVDATP